jgi:tetratricopeptide (TPR) repeat protein
MAFRWSALLPLLFVICESPSWCGEYVAADACAGCHQQIHDAYRQTGMGRSFQSIPREAFRGQNFYHEPSDQHFLMSVRGGRNYQRRWQLDAKGRETNIVEMEAGFVLGSGEHARTFLHRTAAGELIELPVGWYSENGGTWAMNPGYDRADHMDFRRKLDRECLFCHSAYPLKDASVALPQAIDCQRCHGPGRAHIELAAAGKTSAEVRAAIVNPARLTPERQNEVCFQCHLESTSARLPYAVRRYDRGFFSYRPGEPLANYILHFDHAPGTGHDEKFEIDHAAYRLLQSACYRKSNGALTCTACHDPHGQVRAEEAALRYRRACLNCHASARFAADQKASCVECHMAKRRTEDAVHVVMTDHEIRRRPASETPATSRGPYHGPVALLYPSSLPAGSDADLYLAVAQVAEGANLEGGIPMLRQAIEKRHPKEAEFYRQLANAYRTTGEIQAAIPFYEEALRRSPNDAAARIDYAQALTDAGRPADAIRLLEADKPNGAPSLNALGAAWLAANKPAESAAVLRRALRLDPDLPETHVNLGSALSLLGNRAGAIAALSDAIRLRPGSAAAHGNLASILYANGDFDQAKEHFERAIRGDPKDAVARYNYGRALAERKLYGDAEAQLSAAVRLDPHLAEAAVSLGLVLSRTGRIEPAIEAYRQAIAAKPGLISARYDLALALLARGEKAQAAEQFEIVIRAQPLDYESRLRLGRLLLERGEFKSAIEHFEVAAQSPNSDVRAAAAAALRDARKRIDQ